MYFLVSSSLFKMPEHAFICVWLEIKWRIMVKTVNTDWGQIRRKDTPPTDGITIQMDSFWNGNRQWSNTGLNQFWTLTHLLTHTYLRCKAEKKCLRTCNIRTSVLSARSVTSVINYQKHCYLLSFVCGSSCRARPTWHHNIVTIWALNCIFV